MPKRLIEKRMLVGIDEVGRGPLAGPITLAAFIAPENLRNKLIKILGGKIKDSKQFSPQRREEIYREFKKLRKIGVINFKVCHISNKIIDKKGISYATRLGIKRCLKNLDIENYLKIKNFELKIVLDGSLKAPSEYADQKTIIGGDSKNIFIACASIVAKVRRDRLLCHLATKYPLYGLEIHKGYGTALHYKLLKKHGISDIHRQSFLRNLTESSK